MVVTPGLTVFDTSALVAAHTQAHPRFEWADQQVQAAARPALCSHSLAEFYAVMTAHPQLRYAPTQVEAITQRLSTTWTVLTLDTADYLAAIARCRQLGLGGGAIYDTLIAQAAAQAGAIALVTLNAKHFVRLGADIAAIVIQPPAP